MNQLLRNPAQFSRIQRLSQRIVFGFRASFRARLLIAKVIARAGVLIAHFGILVGVSGCGKSAYIVAPTTEAVKASGSYSVPPKADILFVVDDTGSMYQAYPAIKDQFPAFLTQLDQLGYDYHSTVIPMTTFKKVQQVAGSNYDINSSSFMPSYPGDSGNRPGMLPASVYRSSSAYQDFVTQGSMNTSLNGKEPTFENLAAMFASGFKGTNFFRSDAVPVVVMIGNGDDTSGVNYCQRSPDNIWVPCEQVPGTPTCSPTQADPIKGGSSSCASQGTSFNYYQNLFKTTLPGLKIYSVVAYSVTNQCLGGSSYTKVGSRYQNMASAFGGKSISLCSAGGNSSNPASMISSVLGDMASYLKVQKQLYQIEYLMIQPNEVPSQVTLFVGGDPNRPVAVSTDPTKPLYWTYAGMVNNVNTQQTQSPSGELIHLSPASGNAIQFHVNAGGVLPSTADTFQIEEAPPGSTNSVSK